MRAPIYYRSTTDLLPIHYRSTTAALLLLHYSTTDPVPIHYYYTTAALLLLLHCSQRMATLEAKVSAFAAVPGRMDAVWP